MDGPTPAESSTGARRRRMAVAAFAAAAVAAVALALGFAATRPSPVPAQPPEKLSIALASTPHAALLHLAAAKGYYAEEGLDVTLLPASHGKAALDMLAAGKADLAAAAEVPFVISVLKGQDIAIAATVVSVSSEMAVVARRDRAVSAPRDLLGKKIGVSFGTSGEYFLWAFLIRHKLAPERVTLVDVPPPQIAQELARGAIDATSTWQPLRFGAESALGDNAVTFAEPNAYTTTHVVVGRGPFLKEHPEAVRKLVRALLKAERFSRADPQRALTVFAERVKVDTRALQGWQDLDFHVDLRQSQLVTLEDEARWAMARGYAEQRALPNFLPHLYLDALLAVQPDRVTVVR